MKSSRSVFHRAVVLLLMLAFVLVPPAQMQSRLPSNRPGACNPKEWVKFEPLRSRNVRTIQKDSVLVARLDKMLSSKGQERKEPVIAYISTAITDENGVLLVPRNSKVIGQIERIFPATKDRPAMMEVAFNTLRRCIYRNELRPDKELNGDCYYDQVQLGGVMIGLTGNMCRNFNDEDNEKDGVIEGRKPVGDTKNKVKLAAAGAGGGAMLAGIAVGTLTATGIGAGLGLGLGLILARGSKKPGGEVYLEAGTLFGVQLTHPLPLRFLDQKMNYSPRPTPTPTPWRDDRPEEAKQGEGLLGTILESHRIQSGTSRSAFLESLESLRESMTAYNKAHLEKRPDQMRIAVRQLLLRSERVDGAINEDRLVNRLQISPRNIERWRRLESIIQTLANIYKVNF